jgi:hypothetical protein
MGLSATDWNKADDVFGTGSHPESKVQPIRARRIFAANALSHHH